MGYEVHITRKEECSDDGEPIITEGEWKSYVASDSEMVITGVAEHTNPQGETIRLTQPLLTEWRRHSSGAPVWFSYFKGNLSVKNPDEECLAKMRRVAAKLKARVQGDDGEVYDGSDNPAPQRAPSIGQRVSNWLSRFRLPSQPVVKRPPLPFGVGDKVRDPWRQEHTVISIDPKAEHGMGAIRTRRSDGKEFSHAMIAHPFTPIAKEEPPGKQ